MGEMPNRRPSRPSRPSSEQQRADLDEQDVWFRASASAVRVRLARMAATPSRPWRVPTTTTTSPAAKRNVGVGRGDHLALAQHRDDGGAGAGAGLGVAERRVPTYGEPAGMAICSVSSPAACSRSPESWPSISDAPRMSARRLGLVVGERDVGWQESGSSGS